MLVLARREGQKIHVRHKGETLTLTVVEDGTLIRLGFDAPRSFEIVRDDANPREEAETVLSTKPAILG